MIVWQTRFKLIFWRYLTPVFYTGAHATEIWILTCFLVAMEVEVCIVLLYQAWQRKVQRYNLGTLIKNNKCQQDRAVCILWASITSGGR